MFNNKSSVIKPVSTIFRFLIGISIILCLGFLPVESVKAESGNGINVVDVVPGQSVTFSSANLPAGQTYTVKMGGPGSSGADGLVLGTVTTNADGSLQQTVNIPQELSANPTNALRLENNQGYYSYYYYNNGINTTAGNTWYYPPGSTIPYMVPEGPYSNYYYGGYWGYMNITAVVQGQTVTFTTYNLPANQSYTVYVNGYVVGTLYTGAGGAVTASYNVPSWMWNAGYVNVSLGGPGYWYAYDGYNYGTGGPAATATPTGECPKSQMYFVIKEVVKDESVKILTYNFPASKIFIVRMKEYGTAGVGGVEIARTNSGSGGSFEETYTIPDELKGVDRLSIRLETEDGCYAYDWFYNESNTY